MKQNISVVKVFVVCNYKLSQMLAYLRLCLEEEKENGEENILTITIKDQFFYGNAFLIYIFFLNTVLKYTFIKI